MAAKPRIAVVRNGWAIWFWPAFRDRYEALRARTRALRRTLPTPEFVTHPEVKLFAALRQLVNEHVPADPTAEEYRLGGTLGREYGNWRRVKGFGLPERYRLFFKFSSAHRVIVFAWLNDASTLRKAGARSDAYAVFRRMLLRGRPPEDFDVLLREAKENRV